MNTSLPIHDSDPRAIGLSKASNASRKVGADLPSFVFEERAALVDDSGICDRQYPFRVKVDAETEGELRPAPEPGGLSPIEDEIVDTPEQAAALSLVPLLIPEPLQRFLDEHGIGEGEIDAEPVGEGHSNVTYRIRRGDTSVVLRRPPRPPLPPSAHDVLREARVLKALGESDVPVPAVLATCSFAVAQAVARVIVDQASGGAIVNVASILGLAGVGQIPQAGYAASKGGIVNLTRKPAAQWARKGIRVNALAPGWFESEMTEEMFAWRAGRSGLPGAPRWVVVVASRSLMERCCS